MNEAAKQAAERLTGLLIRRNGWFSERPEDPSPTDREILNVFLPVATELISAAESHWAEHPADDGEPLSEDWFAAVAGGFLHLSVGDQFSIEWSGQRRAAFLVFAFSFQENRQDAVCDVPIRTRGDLRRLASALCIPLEPRQ